MAQKRFKKFWLTYGRVSGVSVGICITKYYTLIDLGFWYVGVEY